MSNEILINATASETRVAVIEKGMVQELHLERRSQNTYVGNLYQGKVSRVLPGMQAAFVDIGLERTAFLHANDIVRPAVRATERNGDSEQTDSPSAAPEMPCISELLRPGQQITVQVLKDPIGTKGARLSMQISIPSRYLVLLPDADTIGVSVRIEDEHERDRLREMVQQLAADESADDTPGGETSGSDNSPAKNNRKFGFIVRTNAEGVDLQSLAQDMRYLRRVWSVVDERCATTSSGNCTYEDLTLALRSLRDLMHAGVEKVRIDNAETYARVQQFVSKFMSDWSDRLEHYQGDRPIFDLYLVDDEIQAALGRSTALKSGGYLIIDQTEAMTTIDVNTGAYVGYRNLEETIFKTNLEAAQSIARQLRLRNLGGIVIIDFIDMQDEQHREQVVRTLERALEPDHARVAVNAISSLGLVEMTRKRTTESLAHRLCEPCPTCSGRGEIKSVETVCFEIFREILRAVQQFEAQELLVIAANEVVEKISDEHSTTIAELEETIAKSIRLQADQQYPQEQYDVVLL